MNIAVGFVLSIHSGVYDGMNKILGQLSIGHLESLTVVYPAFVMKISVMGCCKWVHEQQSIVSLRSDGWLS
jgi:hypothetical protein